MAKIKRKRLRQSKYFSDTKTTPKRPHTMTKFQFMRWLSHQERIKKARAVVDSCPFKLDPSKYLNPTLLKRETDDLRKNLRENAQLLQRINSINREGGYVKCWHVPEIEDKSLNKQKLRQKKYLTICEQNLKMYGRILKCVSGMMTTKEHDYEWGRIKRNIIISCKFPFILGRQVPVDKGMVDLDLESPIEVNRPKVWMEINVKNGPKLLKAVIQLFSDVSPIACGLFLRLIKGTASGHAYTGTAIYRIVSGLYFRGGDVAKDDGFGGYCSANAEAENFALKHSVPGIVSMVVNDHNEITGQFNVTFKPMPLLDGRHVVFGRIIGGSDVCMNKLSSMGRPLGRTSSHIIIERCGWYNKDGINRIGSQSKINFAKKK